MKTTVLEINSASPYIDGLKKTLSFKRFVQYIQNRTETETTIKKQYFQYVLDRLTADPAFLEPIDLKEIDRFQEQLNLIYSVMLPPAAEENEVLWAMTTPIEPTIIFGTSAFYTLITDKETGELGCNIVKEEESQMSLKEKTQILYALILKRLYNFDLHFKNDMVLSLIDEQTELPRYFRGQLNTSFIDVYAEGPLPELDFASFQLKEDIDWTALTTLLPFSKLRFEGFSIIDLKEITAEHTVERIKNVILNHSKDEPAPNFNSISDPLKALIGTSEVGFGLLPVLRVNSRVVFSHESYAYSMVMKNAMETGVNEDQFQKLAEDYFQNPKLVLLDNIHLTDPEDHFTELLVRNGVKSYALIPIYYHKRIAGVLEVYSKKSGVLDQAMLSKLDVALPFLAQILQHNIEDFHTRIDNIIRDKFTSIQPSVQWKFREVAWHYLRDESESHNRPEIEPIHFPNVYPLYGAIDIRNSTLERNKALSEDLTVQFNALIETIKAIRIKVNLSVLDELVFKCQKWVFKIQDHSNDHEEIRVKDFFDNEVNPLLGHFRNSYPEVAQILDRYDAVMKESTGAAYANRRALEASMQKINLGLNTYLDLFKNQIQESYPCYFEKFRTDGVEYDIYMGQSIAPHKNFSTLYLKNIRLWQLTSMASIAKLTNALLPTLEKPLETTQLIFINHGSIDISFRDDERRFDVEGAYNIRYHVIKKRIDKVHIASTYERLTQPGKIAMVYFNQKEADEYVEYIRYLQEQGVLANDLEFHELEELQGVTGLKALRVGIDFASPWKPTLDLTPAEIQTV